MKKHSLLLILSSGIILSACSQMPSECEKAWDNMEKLAIESGIPKDAVKAQKDNFVLQIKNMSKEEAIQSCNMQNSVHDKFHRTLILSGFCLLKIAKISLNSSFFPKPIKR